MRTKKQLIGCLAVCLVVFFVSAVYAAPPVEIIRGPAVTIVNSNLKPIPVTEVKQFQFQREMGAYFDANKCWSKIAQLYTVPTDKRLVIEYFSCHTVAATANTALVCVNSNPQ